MNVDDILAESDSDSEEQQEAQAQQPPSDSSSSEEEAVEEKPDAHPEPVGEQVEEQEPEKAPTKQEPSEKSDDEDKPEKDKAATNEPAKEAPADQPLAEEQEKPETHPSPGEHEEVKEEPKQESDKPASSNGYHSEEKGVSDGEIEVPAAEEEHDQEFNAEVTRRHANSEVAPIQEPSADDVQPTNSGDVRRYKDDMQIQSEKRELAPREMMRARQTLQGGTQQFKTFTEGQDDDNVKKVQSKIFADGLKIDQSPSKIDIETSEQEQDKDEKDILQDLLNESSSEEVDAKADDDGESSNKKPAADPKGDKNSEGSEEKKAPKEFNEDDEISEEERRRLLEEMIDGSSEDSDEDDLDEDEDDSDEDDDSESDARSGRKDSISDDSFQDMNKSLDSGPAMLQEVKNKENYLPFISEKFAFKNDILEVIDRNERSFKIVAEKMIQKSSQLDMVQGQTTLQDQIEGANMQPQRRLMRFKTFDKIANRFHGDVKAAQGAPQCIAALEDFIVIGSTDGTVRLFNALNEQEIKVLTGKDLKGNGVFSVDIKRVKGNNLLQVVAGHQKGHVSLYEIKGLPKYPHQGGGGGLLSSISFRHLKTVSDIHDGQVVQVKFYGEFKREVREIRVISCDINGTVYLSRFTEQLLGYACHRQCFWKKRLNGPAFRIAPFFYDFEKTEFAQIGVFNKEGNPYASRSPMEQMEYDERLSERRSHIVVFGALERVIITQIAPTPKELFTIERPDYIDAQIVPYIDWGEGLSPVYRDTTYPILAIAWGRTIQLAIWTNPKETNGEPEIKFDGFYICDGFSIDQCFFLDESLLMVLINKKEVRILYTQHFTPGMFDEKMIEKPSKNADPISNKKQFLQIKDKFTGLVNAYAEVDKGYRLLQKEEIRHKDIITVNAQQLKSKFNFNPTITKNFSGSIVCIGKTTVGNAKLIHWEEYLLLIRGANQNDWLKVLRAALDIFNGKMVGLGGLPDQREARELQLREKMKDLLRENIDACIKEFQEGMMVQSKTLRVATEFCIKVGAVDHLFGELFDMFAEAGIEQRFFENLEAFILSGKLKWIKIPTKILSRIIQYYRMKDVELLEKSILNLNLNHYANNLEVRHICEEELLSSALIHMLITIFDKDKNMENTVCLHILCALFNLMNKSKIQRTYDEVMHILSQGKDSTILFEANQLDEKMDPDQEKKRADERVLQQEERQKKLDTEHSSTYIGYKLMWVIRMFLEGKKFPNGSLSSFKWRMYVFDIVRFITTEQFLNWFLNFDAQRFFALILPLFVDPEPFQFILYQKSFVEMQKDTVPGLEECGSHKDILNKIHKGVSAVLEKDRADNHGQMSEKCELLENSYMFFIAKISKQGEDIKIDQELYISTIIKQLQFHRKLQQMELNIEDLLIAHKNTQGLKTASQLTQAISSQKFLKQPGETLSVEDRRDRNQALYKYLVQRNEQDVLTMIRQIEDDLDEDVIKEFCAEADHSPMYMVRVYLHQILHNYQKCLSMFFKVRVIRENVFKWLTDIQANIEMNLGDKEVVAGMQSLILKNTSSFVKMDPALTANLCDQWFDQDYSKMVDAICQYPKSQDEENELCFQFIDTVLKLKEKEIKDDYNQKQITGKSSQLIDAEMFQRLILKLVHILCERKYRKLAMDYVQREYFPIEECLQICREKGVLDAQAVLYQRKGEYQTAISLYVQVLTQLSKDKVISALFIKSDVPFNCPDNKKDIKRFDELLNLVIGICDYYGSRLPSEQETEGLWIFSIEKIYQIREQVMESMANLEEEDLHNFHVFLLIRIQAFMMRMAEHVKLAKIIDFLHSINQQNTYQEFQPTFEEKVKREIYHENILNNAGDLLLKDIMADMSHLNDLRSEGCVAKQVKCDRCHLPLQNRWSKQHVFMFKCKHNFHQMCIKKGEPNCAICFNEYDNIQKIIQSRSSKVRIGVRGRSGSEIRRTRTSSKATAAASESEESDSEMNSSMRDDELEDLAPIKLSEQEMEAQRFEECFSRFDISMNQREMLLDHYD